jgi:hypothetical protein
MTPTQTFGFRYGVFGPFLRVMGMGPRFSSVELADDVLRVRMGWAFSAEIPVSSITGVGPHKGLVGGIGVHGWRGRWLVNGAAKGIVTVNIDPRARGRVLGVPVKLRTLWVSVESPEEMMRALADRGVQQERQDD